MSQPWICCKCGYSNDTEASNPCPGCEHTMCAECELGQAPNNSISRDDSSANYGVITQGFVWSCCSCGSSNSDLTTTCLCGHVLDGNCQTMDIRSSSTTGHMGTNHSISPKKHNGEGWSCHECGASNSWTSDCPLCGH